MPVDCFQLWRNATYVANAGDGAWTIIDDNWSMYGHRFGIPCTSHLRYSGKCMTPGFPPSSLPNNVYITNLMDSRLWFGPGISMGNLSLAFEGGDFIIDYGSGGFAFQNYLDSYPGETDFLNSYLPGYLEFADSWQADGSGTAFCPYSRDSLHPHNICSTWSGLILKKLIQVTSPGMSSLPTIAGASLQYNINANNGAQTLNLSGQCSSCSPPVNSNINFGPGITSGSVSVVRSGADYRINYPGGSVTLTGAYGDLSKRLSGYYANGTLHPFIYPP